MEFKELYGKEYQESYLLTVTFLSVYFRWGLTPRVFYYTDSIFI